MSQRNHSYVAVALAVLTVVSALSSGIALDVVSADTREITECTTISTPGTYVLTDSISDSDAKGACIRIESDDVVFDGDSNVVDGVDGADTRGIAVESAEGVANVTIRRVTVTDWETAVGLRFAADVVVDDVSALSNLAYGVSVNGSTGVTVRECTFGESGTGVRVTGYFAPADAVVRDSSFYGNRVGLAVEDADGTRVVENTVRNSRFDGVRAFTNGTTIENNTLTGNGYHGVSLYQGHDNVVRGNEIRINGKAGVHVGRSNRTVIEGNVIAGNGEVGVFLHPQGLEIGEPGFSSHNVIRNNTLAGIGAERPGSTTAHTAGVRLELATHNEISGNDISGYGAGIEFYKPVDADPEAVDPVGLNRENVVVGNNVTDNGVGVYVNEWDSRADEYYTVDNLVYDNYLNNSVDAQFNDGTGTRGVSMSNRWNVTPQAGTNVVGGDTVGGNFWAAPSGQGFSQTCGDADADGLCDGERPVAANNVDRAPIAAERSARDQSPVAAFEFLPSTPLPGEPVAFDAAGSSDADGSVVSYEWDFDGDGVFDASGLAVNRSFAVADEYRTTLRVTDDDGLTNTTTRTVSVLSLDPTPPDSGVGETTLRVTQEPPVCAAPGDRLVTTLNVTDLVSLRIDAETVGPMAPENLSLSVNGRPRDVRELVTYDPTLTDELTVRVELPADSVGAVSLAFEDADGTFLGASGPTSVHGEAIVVPDDVSTVRDAVAIACAGGIVEVRPGTYEEAMYLAKSVTIRNASETSPVLRGPPSVPVVTVGAGGNLTVEGLTMESEASAGTIVSRRGAVAVRVFRSTLSGDYNGAWVSDGDFEMRDSRVENASGGVQFYGWDDPDRVRVSDTVFDLSPGANSAVLVSDLGTGFESVVLADNVVTVPGGNARVGFEVYSVTAPVEITGNRVSGVERAVDLSNVSDALVEGNDLSAATAGTDGAEPLVTVDETGVATLRDNRLDGGSDGVFVADGANVTLESNRVANATDAGIRVDDASAIVRNNTVSNVTGSGIVFQKLADGVAGGNEIAGVVGAGVAVLSGSQADVVNNLVTLAESDPAFRTTGIEVFSSPDVDVVDNTVRGGDEAIRVGSSTGVTLRANTVVDADVGVAVGGAAQIPSEAVLRENELTNVSEGVRVGEGGYAHLYGNAFTDVAGWAVRLDCDDDTAALGAVEFNEIRNATGGVVVAPSQATAPIRYNSFVDVSSAAVDACSDRDVAGQVAAPLNYYGPDGPRADGQQADGPSGVHLGDVVGVEPFLTKPPGDVDTDRLQAFGFSLTMAPGRVYALGTPAPLDRTLAETFGDFEGAVYRYDGDGDSWTLATGDETLGAMDAVAVVPTTDARAVVDFADATPARPTARAVRQGWNFLAPRDNASAEDAFSSRTVPATDLLELYAQPAGTPGDVVGDAFGSYTFATETTTAGGPTVSPFTGYFVYATAAGEIPGRLPAGVTLAQFRDRFPDSEPVIVAPPPPVFTPSSPEEQALSDVQTAFEGVETRLSLSAAGTVAVTAEQAIEDGDHESPNAFVVAAAEIRDEASVLGGDLDARATDASLVAYDAALADLDAALAADDVDATTSALAALATGATGLEAAETTAAGREQALLDVQSAFEGVDGRFDLAPAAATAAAARDAHADGDYTDESRFLVAADEIATRSATVAAELDGLATPRSLAVYEDAVADLRDAVDRGNAASTVAALDSLAVAADGLVVSVGGQRRLVLMRTETVFADVADEFGTPAATAISDRAAQALADEAYGSENAYLAAVSDVSTHADALARELGGESTDATTSTFKGAASDLSDAVDDGNAVRVTGPLSALNGAGEALEPTSDA